MKNMMIYKGYYGSIMTNLEENILYGKLEFIRDLVSYEGNTPKDLRNAFEEAVDDYLDTCEQTDRTPEKPFKGSFSIRIGEDFHAQAAIAAFEKGISLNEFVKLSIENELRKINFFKEKEKIETSIEDENKDVFFNPKSNF